ncbi:hypothetical protein C7974DRAFT_204211 [Boeremia exigua]|uniref:uncharacterized protein n=1 Tax=Boeremia exigua TaxID=749465 RepID=UPI001E8ED860|nr:uncharacterized protein C7974DRAFT_204211 [Boeremia exigua]KAH6625640.1 hypothetical protein C7974DRAFT_204211 [Boeremia exigua]
MILALPTELRLRIAEYALEQRPAAGIPYMGSRLQEHENEYRPSQNLALLLVCRQFNTDFAQLAYNKTRFVLWDHERGTHLQQLPPHILRDIRKLAFLLGAHEIQSWDKYFYDVELLRLDELVFLCPARWTNGPLNIRNVVRFLRRLAHVKTVKFVVYGKGEGLSRAPCFSLIGMIMKEDHFQRYDAPGAPNIEATGWDWHISTPENSVTLKAREPRPVLAEEDYMLLMKPEVDAFMAAAQREAGL